MPSSTLSLLLAGLAFSSQVFLVFAAPAPLTWYLAPTSTKASTLAPSSTSSLVWYKADPTTSSSSSSVAPPSPSSTSPVYTGHLGLNSVPRPPIIGGRPVSTVYGTGTPSEAFPGMVYAGKSVCPNATLPESFRALTVMEREMQGIAINEGFSKTRGGLRAFCGKQVKLTNPYNPSSPPLVYTVTRLCPSEWCSQEGLSVSRTQGGQIGKIWEWENDQQVSQGKASVQFQFL